LLDREQPNQEAQTSTTNKVGASLDQRTSTDPHTSPMVDQRLNEGPAGAVGTVNRP